MRILKKKKAVHQIDITPTRREKYQENIEKERAESLERHYKNKERNNKTSLNYYHKNAPKLNRKRRPLK